METPSTLRADTDLIALAVLALLAEQPRHPYEMQRLLRERHNDFAVGKTRSFYDAVNRLVRHGLVEPGETTREGKHPERTVYHITEAGRRKFDGWLEYLLVSPLTEFPAFTVAVNFLGHFTPPHVARLLRTRAAALEVRARGLVDVLAHLMGEVGLPRVVLLEQEHALALLQAELAWVRAVADDMESGRLVWDWQRDPVPGLAVEHAEKGSGER